MMNCVLHVASGVLTKQWLQASLGKFLVVGVKGLRDPIGVNDKTITWFKLNTLLLKQHVVRDTQGNSPGQGQKFSASVSMNQQRRRMPGVDIRELTPARIQNGIKNRDEHATLVVLAQDIIHAGDDRTRRDRVLCRSRSEQGFGNHAEQRCRHPFAANIGHHHADLATLELEMVIEVATDLLGRAHRPPQ